MNWLEGRFRHAADRESGPLQIMYGIDGREDLPEEELWHLEGYMGSAPVRIGNQAATQLQLDIYGELMDSVYHCNKYGLPIYHDGWMELTRNLEWLMDHWDQPDEGIWEARGGRRDYTYSRLMSWVAVERAIRVARQRGLPADIPRWSAVRDRIYKQIMERGWHPARRARRRGGDLLAVLLLVGGGARPGRAARRGAAGLREDAHLREPRRAVLGGDRADGRAARQLPPGLDAPGADQRRLQPGPPARVSVGGQVVPGCRGRAGRG
jgi:glycosyl hydrolase family 15